MCAHTTTVQFSNDVLNCWQPHSSASSYTENVFSSFVLSNVGKSNGMSGKIASPAIPFDFPAIRIQLGANRGTSLPHHLLMMRFSTLLSTSHPVPSYWDVLAMASTGSILCPIASLNPPSFHAASKLCTVFHRSAPRHSATGKSWNLELNQQNIKRYFYIKGRNCPDHDRNSNAFER